MTTTPETTPETMVGAGPSFIASDEIIYTKLEHLGLTKDQISKITAMGAETLEDLANITEQDLINAGVLPLKARKIIKDLKPTTPQPTISQPTSVNFDTVLPTVPDDAAWLNSLRTGGVLKVEQSTVISAIRAALADQFDFYEIPDKLIKTIDEYIDTTEEQVTEEYWTIRKQLTRKSYGDLFAAIDGIDGNFVTKTRKQELLNRINSTLWPSIVGFYDALSQWQDAFMKGSTNPAMLIMAMTSNMGGIMPPIQPPDCSVLRDAAATVNDAINKTFRGTGVQISAALAYEANQIKNMIENPRLLIACGVISRDLLLKKLGVNVPPVYPRMEQNVTRFVLGIVGVDKVAGGTDELQYFTSLYMLGSQIPWNDLKPKTTHDTTNHETMWSRNNKKKE